MDIQLLDKETLKVKSKHSTLVINPTSSMSKTEADATVFLSEKSPNYKVEGARVSIKGPGEYEVGGIKVTGLRVEGENVFSFDVDGVKVLVGKVSAVAKIIDKIPEVEVVILDVDEQNDSLLTKIEPRVLIFYGEGKEDLLKKLGKTSSSVSKYSTNLEKLPEEMEVINLG